FYNLSIRRQRKMLKRHTFEIFLFSKGKDPRLRGNNGLEVARNLKKKNRNQTSRIPATFLHSRENGNLDPQTFR
ncbi:hypothetical protein, partial [Neisseria meningitidis]|uniref:hypothetical protein n=1 Tax=Neisseria meningitidis TaxID=487 RepID=UPI001C594F16